MRNFNLKSKNDLNTPEFLAWRRLHLSKSKLSNCTEIAEIMAAFSVVTTVELQINDGDVNPGLLLAFVITTCLLVSVALLAVMISTCILPHIEAVSKMGLMSQVHLSPHDSMAKLIDLCWVLTNTVSLFLFTLDVILMCWIKFSFFTKVASIAATAIMGPVLVIILVFGVVFYRKIVTHHYDVSYKKCEDLERLHEALEVESTSTNTIHSTLTYDIEDEREINYRNMSIKYSSARQLPTTTSSLESNTLPKNKQIIIDL